MRVYFLIILLILPILLFPLSPDKQLITQYSKRHWTTANGLPQDSIISIIQDKKGYIWIATQNGFTKFNGVEFKVFNNKNISELKSNNIVHLNADNQNNIWVSTKKGLLFFNDIKNKLFTENEGLFSNVISLTYIDKNNIWVGTSNGLNLIQNNRVTDFKDSSILKKRYIYSLIKTKNNNMYIGTNKGLFRRYNNNIKEVFYKKKRLKITQFLKRKNGEILFVSWNKIFILKNNSEIEEFGENLNLKIKSALYLIEDNNENLWITSKIEPILIRITKEYKIRYFDLSKIIPDTVIRAFFQDRENNLWIGTFNSGLYMLHDTIFTTFKYRDDFLIFKAIEHQYFPEIYNKKLNINENGEIKTVNILEELKFLRSIYIENDKSIWFSLRNGIIRYKNSILKTINSENSVLSKYPITSLFKDYENRLWITDRIGNIYIFINEKIKKVDEVFGFKKCLISDIIDDDYKNVWFATDGCGLGKLNNNKLKYFTGKDGLTPQIIYGLLKYKFLWITTKNGLYIYKNNKFYKVKSNNKSFNEELYGIIKDNFDNIWISSNRGIFFIKNNEVEKLIEDINYKLNIRQFDFDEGLKSLDFLKNQMPSVWKTSDGKIWFPSLKGISVANPKSVTANELSSPLYIESIKIDGEKYNKKNKINIKPSSSEIEFKFSLLSFKNPKKNKYKYKLEGYNKNWIELKNENKVVYMNLPAGSYTFRVIGANSDEIWNFKGDKFSFRKSQYFYETILFKIITIILLLFLFYFLYKIRTKKLENERKKLEIINKKLKSVDKMKDRILANTSHELRTPLNGIIGLSESLMENNDINSIKYNLNIIKASGYRLSNLINDILDFQKTKTGKLKLNLKSVQLYNIVESVIELSSYNIKNKNIIFKNKVAQNVILKADYERITQVLYNLIGNAIKFTKKGEIVVSAHKKDSFYEITVKDTGIGIPQNKLNDIFNVFEQIDIDNYEYYSGTGLGLSITKQLIELHGGEIRVESVENRGSSFIFTIPESQEKEFLYKENNTTNNNLIKIKKDADNNEKNSYTVFTIDDENINQHVLKTQLKQVGYDVKQFFTGKEAIKHVYYDKPDIIILDIMMPEMSGYEVCRKIREKYNSSELPIIMLTAKVETKDLLEGFKSGANDYIHKPFSKDELITRIAYHLSLIEKFNKEKLELKEDIEYQKEEIDAINSELKEKYLNNKIKESTIDEYMDKIRNYLDTEKAYMNPNFSLADLSKITNISSHNISQVINKKMDSNFYTFINTYRVHEVIKMFNNHEFDDKTILSILYTAGFKSKSTFNRVFKNITGKTPLKYRKELLKP